jgi:Tfp pilus assembly PilM family ATPase
LGAATTSIHFIKDGQSNFIRDVSWGGKELIQAIAKARRCDQDEAEKLLIKGDPKAPPPTPTPAHDDVVEVKPEELSPLGGGLLEPLADELGAFDEPAPSKVSSFSGIGGMGIGADANKTISEILAHPLGRLVSEIRRSFDYYEQQLYEHPVTRLILSGGVAQVPLLAETLREDLGVELVELADPASGAIQLSNEPSIASLREQSSQFMVAVGLAARGAWEL